VSAAQSSRISRLAAVPFAVLVVSTLALSAPARKASAHAGYAQLPATFVPNAGQFRSRELRYVAQGAGYTFAFTRQQIKLSFARGTVASLRFVHANPGVQLEARSKLPAKVNYLIGRDPANWRTGLPTYRELVYRNLWPGIDLHLQGEPGRLKYEFQVQAGADPSRILVTYQGARGVSRTRAGTRPLAMDAGLDYSTYLGGSGDEGASSIAVEGGYAYVVGCTTSDDFPTTPGAFQTGHNPGGDFPCDAFVSKLAKDGSTLVYSTYLGGSDTDVGNGIGVAAGRAYVTGVTFSPDFPTTTGAFQRAYGGGDGELGDGFVTELSKDGSALVYSTYLGGSGGDQSNDVRVESGNAYVTGITRSTDFPTTGGAFQQTNHGGLDVFVTKLARDGSALSYSTLLGGSDDEESERLALEGGRVYVTGLTRSSDFPTTPGAFQPAYAGGDDDAFATEVAKDGSALGYSTFLGGTSGDHGVGIAVEGGDAYVAGITASTDFPTTPGAFQPAYGGGFRDAFVTKLDRRGSTLAYSTYLGGQRNDNGLSIAVEGGRASVTGLTGANDAGPGENDFPTTPNAAQPVFGGFFDAFVTTLDGHASSLDYSTYLGGSDYDEGDGIALGADRAFVAGSAGSGFPTTAHAFQPTFAGGFSDAFVTKLKTN
jgi:hypothetical protein